MLTSFDPDRPPMRVGFFVTCLVDQLWSSVGASSVEVLRRVGCEVEFDDWRTADQRYYVSDTRKFSAATGWKQTVTVKRGVARLFSWLQAQRRRTRFVASPVARGEGISQAVNG